MKAKTTAAIWKRLIGVAKEEMPAEAARYLLGLDFPKKDHERVAQLSARASAGSLSPGEQTDLNEYLRVADMLAVWKSKARLALRQAGVTH